MMGHAAVIEMTRRVTRLAESIPLRRRTRRVKPHATRARPGPVLARGRGLARRRPRRLLPRLLPILLAVAVFVALLALLLAGQ